MTGSSLGKYEMVRRLGGGGMAEVFLARTIGVEGFARPVAIKRVLPSYAADATFAKMFVGEAQITARLRHSNIVSVLDFDRDAEGGLFLVMELVEGKDLDGLMQSGPLPLPVVIYVTVQVLRGLGAAHEAADDRGKLLGLVHRDVSPHNVLLSWDGGVKVSDFGIAKAFQASNVQHSGMIKGKAQYMSPEQVTTVSDLDNRSDLFAVGVMLHEMLTGDHVFKGETVEQVLTQVIAVSQNLSRIPAPVEVRRDVPADLSAVTMGLLAVDRGQRFARAQDAIDALLACQDASLRGQEMLAAVMAERFPGQAPATPGLGHAPPASWPAGTPGPAVETRVGHRAAAAMPPTMVSDAAGPAAAPGPHAVPTMTLTGARPAPRRRWLLPVALALVAAAVAAIVVIVARGGNRTPADDRAAAGATADAAPTTAPATTAGSALPPDAGAATAATLPDAAAPETAVVPTAPPPDAAAPQQTASTTTHTRHDRHGPRGHGDKPPRTGSGARPGPGAGSGSGSGSGSENHLIKIDIGGGHP